MRFSVDPWDPTYGASLDTELGHSTAEIDASVEVPAARWAPIGVPAAPTAPAAPVLFVDGVRRVDAQVWVDDVVPGIHAAASPALCASYAAGVICCCAEQGAHLLAGDIRRGLFTTSADSADVVTSAGIYTATPTAPRDDIAPQQLLSLALQRSLDATELAVAEIARLAGSAEIGLPDPGSGGSGPGGSASNGSASNGSASNGSGAHTPAPESLLVLDGPLRGRQHLPRTIGFVKSHRSDYLPPALGGVVAELAPGQRTPVFGLGTSWERHTWYLRLPCAPGAPWAGIVRVEASAGPESLALATASQSILPRYASTEYKDSRAPQNLYPIAGLERALRRRLGDPGLLYRALRSASMRQAVTTG